MALMISPWLILALAVGIESASSQYTCDPEEIAGCTAICGSSKCNSPSYFKQSRSVCDCSGIYEISINRKMYVPLPAANAKICLRSELMECQAICRGNVETCYFYDPRLSTCECKGDWLAFLQVKYPYYVQ